MALEHARSTLATGVEEAEAELVRARARARELRDSLTTARELARVGTGVVRPTEAVAAPARLPGRTRFDLADAADLAAPPPLSVRQRAALECIRRGRLPKDMRSSFSPNVVLRWEGDSPLAGTYAGRKEALALLELVLRQIDSTVDPETYLHVAGAAVRIVALPGVRGAADVRLPVTALIHFDERDRIDRLSVTPEEGDALDGLIEAALADETG
jgi:hypothetical protein